MSIRPPVGSMAHARSGSSSSRISELLDSLKVECENMGRESNLVKLQKEEFERKLQQQIQEVQAIQQQIYDLERNHLKLKQKYDEEVHLLRRQLQASVGEPTVVTQRNLTGEKRPLSSLELGAVQNLEALTKRQQRELPISSTGPMGSNIGSNLTSFNANTLSITQIAKQAGTPKRAALPDSPKQSQQLQQLPPPHLQHQQQHPHPPQQPQHQPPQQPQQQHQQLPQQQTLPPHLSPPPVTPQLSFSSNANATQSSPQSPERNGSSNINLAPPMSPASSSNGNNKKKKKSSSTEMEPEGNDWVVGYNPSVLRRIDVKLDHDLEHDSVVCCVNFSAEAKYLATGCNHSAQIFDVKTGAKLHIFKDKPETDTDLYIRSVCFSPDGKYLATGAEDKTVKLWDIETEQIWHNLTGHELDIYSLDFTPDGRYVISGSGDKKVKIWRLEDAKCIYSLGDDQVGPKDGVTSVSVSPDGRQVAAGSLDRIVRLWDIETGIFLGTFEGHSDSVYSVAFSPDGKSLASGSLDKSLKLWDLNRQQRRCRTTLNGHRDFVLSVAFSPDGNWLASGSKDRSVQFWDPRTSVTHMILQGHRNSVISVALSGEKDGSSGIFATGSGDWRARIWNYKVGNFGGNEK